MRRQVDAAVGDGGDHGDQLNWRDGYLLANGDGADGGATPALDWLQQAAGFAGQLDAGAGAEAEVTNVLIEAVRADFEGHLDSAYVARFLQRLVDWDDAEVLPLVVVDDAARDGDFASLAVDRVVGRDELL